jgi:uncharacterized RDD family membrane protein YckC
VSACDQQAIDDRPLAGANRRLAARFAELPAGVGIVAVMFLIGWLIDRSMPPDDPGHGIAYVAMGAGALVAAVYEVVLTGIFGQTLGKRFMHIRVVSERTGAPPGLGRAAIRFLVLWSFWITTVATLVMIYSDNHHRRGLHDVAARTRVIDTR